VAPRAIGVQLLTHNVRNAITDGIWRVVASGFSAVLKVVVHRPGGDVHWQPSRVPTHWNYWRREADAYRSGITDAFRRHGVRGPCLLQVVERDRDAVAIWMEDVEGRPGAGIDARSLRDLSRRLGSAQGSWISEQRSLPPFASRRFLREYIASKTLGWELLDSDVGWQHELVAACFPEELREGASLLHREREWFLAVMEQPMRTGDADSAGMELMGLNHVSLNVRNLDEALSFNRNVLGLRLLDRPDLGRPGAWLAVAGL
jgi:hypothetical protein